MVTKIVATATVVGLLGLLLIARPSGNRPEAQLARLLLNMIGTIRGAIGVADAGR